MCEFMKSNLFRIVGILALHFLVAASVQAAVVSSGTRFVYVSTAKEVSIHLTNAGEQPALVQAWLDNGDSTVSPENIKVPFLLSPSLARIDPGKGQTLRLIHTGEALPQDRESIYWLNIYEVAPKANLPADANTLQFAVRTRLKVFYRPATLKDEISKMGAKLQWKSDGDSQGLKYTVSNPTPYYISIGDVRLQSQGVSVSKPLFTMVAPNATQSLTFLPAESADKSAKATDVRYVVIDDLGATSEAGFNFTAGKK